MVKLDMPWRNARQAENMLNEDLATNQLTVTFAVTPCFLGHTAALWSLALCAAADRGSRPPPKQDTTKGTSTGDKNSTKFDVRTS